MDDKSRIEESAGKLLTLEKVKQLIESDQGEGFILRGLARNLVPDPADLDKLCREYRRTWEENELYAGKNTPETDLIIWGQEDSEWHLEYLPSPDAVAEMYQSMNARENARIQENI